MYVILIWRPEATTGDDHGYSHPEFDPFDGVEVLMTCKHEQFANDAIAAQQARHPDWKFSIEKVELWYTSELMLSDTESVELRVNQERPNVLTPRRA